MRNDRLYMYACESKEGSYVSSRVTKNLIPLIMYVSSCVNSLGCSTYTGFQTTVFCDYPAFYRGEISVSFRSCMMIMYAFFYLSCLLSICCTFVKLYNLNLLFSSFFSMSNC